MLLKRLNNATGIDASNLAAKENFVALSAEGD